MKRFLLFCCALISVIAINNAKAQNKADQDAAMKAWQAYMTPGDPHKMMAKDDGEWKAEVTSWMAPDAPPTKSTGTCVNKMILGGRYQQSKFTGTFMDKPFEGISTVGYDNAKKVYVSSWVDNMGTGIMYMEGTWNDADKSITYTGKSVDPMTGKDCSMKQIVRMIDDKNQVMEMYSMTPDGKEFKTMEIKFTRK